MATSTRRLSKAEEELLELIRLFEEATGRKYDPNSPMRGGFNPGPSATPTFEEAATPERAPTPQSIIRRTQLSGLDVPQEDVAEARATIRQGRTGGIEGLGQAAAPVFEPISTAAGVGLGLLAGGASAELTAREIGYRPVTSVFDDVTAEEYKERLETPGKELKESLSAYADAYSNTEGSAAQKMQAGTAAAREVYPEIPDWAYLGAEILVEEGLLLLMTGGGSGLLAAGKALPKISAAVLKNYKPEQLLALKEVVKATGAALEVTGTAAKFPLRFENWLAEQGIRGVVEGAKLTALAPGAIARGFLSPGGPAGDSIQAVSTRMGPEGPPVGGQGMELPQMRGGSGEGEGRLDPRIEDELAAVSEFEDVVGEVAQEGVEGLPKESIAVKQAIQTAGERPIAPVKIWKAPTTAKAVKSQLEKTEEILDALNEKLVDASEAAATGIEANIKNVTAYQTWLNEVSEALGDVYDPIDPQKGWTEVERIFGRKMDTPISTTTSGAAAAPEQVAGEVMQAAPFDVGNTVYFEGKRYEITKPAGPDNQLEIVERTKTGSKKRGNPTPILVEEWRVTTQAAAPAAPAPVVAAAPEAAAPTTPTFEEAATGVQPTRYELQAQERSAAQQATGTDVGAPATRPGKIRIDKKGPKAVTGNYVDKQGEPVEIALTKTGSTWNVSIQRGTQVSSANNLNSAPMSQAKALLEVQHLIDDPNFPRYVEGGNPPQLLGATKDSPASWASGERSYTLTEPAPLFTTGLTALPEEIAELQKMAPRSVRKGDGNEYFVDGDKTTKTKYNAAKKINDARAARIAEAESARKVTYLIDGKNVSKKRYDDAQKAYSERIAELKRNPVIPVEAAVSPDVTPSVASVTPQFTVSEGRGANKNKFKVHNGQKPIGRFMSKSDAEQAVAKANAAAVPTPASRVTTASAAAKKKATFKEMEEILEQEGTVDIPLTPPPQFFVATDGKKFWVVGPGGKKLPGKQPKNKLAATKLAARKNTERGAQPSAPTPEPADVTPPAAAADEVIPEPTAAAPEPKLTDKEIQKKYGSIYAGGFANFPEDLRPIMKQVVEELVAENPDAIAKASRKTISEAEGRLLADDIARKHGIPAWKPGKNLNYEETILVGEMLGSATRATKAIADKIEALRISTGGSPTPDALLLEQYESLVRSGNLYMISQGSASEMGRAFRAQQMVISATKEYGPDGKLKPDVFSTLIKKLGIKREQLESFAEAFSKIDPSNPYQVTAFIRSFNRPTMFNYVFEIFINSILSSPLTHLRNALGNTLAITLSASESVLAASLEQTFRGAAKIHIAPKAWLDRPKQRFFTEEMSVIADVIGIREGVRGFLETMRHGITPDKASKLEFYQKAFTGKTGTFLNTPTRLLEASDAFYYSINSRIQTNKFAIREAHTTVDADGNLLEGQALLDRIVELKENPTDAMRETIHKASEYRLFRQEPGEVGQKVMSLREKVPALKFFIPFYRTPTNLFKFGIERTPLGLLQGGSFFKLYLDNTFIKAFKAGDAEAVDIAAKSMIGTVAMFGVYQAFADGKITGAVPTTSGKRDEFYRQEKQPYSIKIAGHWFEYRRLEPFNQIFSTIAAIDNIDTDEGIATNLAQVALDLGKGAVSQTWLQGVTDLIGLFDGDDTTSFEKTIARMALSFIPYSSASRFVSRQIDTRMLKETEDNFLGRIKGLAEQQLGFLPGISAKGQLPRRDAWGREVYKQNILSPIAISKEDITSVDAELSKFPDYAIAPVTNQFLNIELTPEWHDYKKLLYGQAKYMYLTLEVESPFYQAEDNLYEKEQRLKERVRDAEALAQSILKAHMDNMGYIFNPALEEAIKRGDVPPEERWGGGPPPGVPFPYGEPVRVKGTGAQQGTYPNISSDEQLLRAPGMQRLQSQMPQPGDDASVVTPTMPQPGGDASVVTPTVGERQRTRHKFDM
jgi:hypothetical protein